MRSTRGLIDYFDLVCTKNPQFWKFFLENGSHFFPKQPSKSYFGDPIRHKNSEKGPTFSSKIPERVE